MSSLSKPQCVALISGGLDSIIMGHELLQRYDVIPLWVDYGQRHRRELKCAYEFANRCNKTLLQISLPILAGSKSALTDSSQVLNEKEPAVVPFRNYTMLLMAAIVAFQVNKSQSDVTPFRIAIGVSENDFRDYPDCRLSVIERFESALNSYLIESHYGMIAILTPHISRTKTEIVLLGKSLGVDFAQTYTCYVGGKVACGRCHTCLDRLGAFKTAGLQDPLLYMGVAPEFANVAQVAKDKDYAR